MTQTQKTWLGGLNHVQRQRLRFLESRLLWGGEVNRRDICDEFGVTPNHFSRDVRAYKEHFPSNIRYDEISRSYRPTENFQPALASEDPGEYLALLRTRTAYPVDSLRTEVGGDVPCDVLRAPEGNVDKEILRRLLRTISQNTGCVIRYQSFSRADADRRTIWPHALAWTGDRWHVRAFDARREMHVDLALLRISSIKITGTPCPRGATFDSGWEELETVEVIPNPDLSAGQQRVIAKEYGMVRHGKDWVWAVSLRRCMVPYFLSRFRLDEDRTRQTANGFPLQRIVLRDPAVRERYRLRRD